MKIRIKVQAYLFFLIKYDIKKPIRNKQQTYKRFSNLSRR